LFCGPFFLIIKLNKFFMMYFFSHNKYSTTLE
jgi:hypothetical protein